MNNTIAICSSCGTKNRIPAGKQHMKPKCGKCKQPVDMTNYAVPVELTDSEFNEFIKSAKLPVMVDFYSPTCGPCHSMSPIVNLMAKEHLGKFIIAKIDTSVNHLTAGYYNIRGVPTFMFFRNGSMTDQIAGAVPRHVLEEKLDS